MTNIEKAKEFAKYYAGESYYLEEAAYSSAMAMAEWKDSLPISADTFRQCIYMLNNTCYEEGTGVDENDIEYTIKQLKLV